MLREYAHHLSAVAGMDARLFSISSCEFLSEPRFCAGACPLLGQSCSLKNTHLYGSYESERWGNRYIYYCPLGMIFISCTIKDPQTYAEYALIVGPMIMGELSDFYALTGHKSISLEGVPAVSTAQVNSVCQISSLICCGLAENPQGKTAGHFQNEKVDQVFHSLYDDKKPYPIDVEKKTRQVYIDGRQGKRAGYAQHASGIYLLLQQRRL